MRALARPKVQELRPNAAHCRALPTENAALLRRKQSLIRINNECARVFCYNKRRGKAVIEAPIRFTKVTNKIPYSGGD